MTPQYTRFAYIVLGVSTVLAFLLRLRHIGNLELDVDTSCAIASAISIDHYPDKIWRLLNYSDSRPLSVLPVYLLQVLDIPVNYLSTELLGLLLWVVTAWVFYLSLRFFASARKAVLLTALLILYFGAITTAEFTPYNSEAFSITLLSICLYLFLRLTYTGYQSAKLVALLGLLLGSLIYAKFQNAPMGLLIAVFTYLGVWRVGKWPLFTVAGILPTLVINLIYLTRGKVREFWVNYLFNYAEYSYTTKFSPLSLPERFHPLHALNYLVRDYQSAILFGGLLLSIFLGGMYYLFSRKKTTEKYVIGFGFALILTSLYAILQSGNYFGHYKLYLIIPLLFFVGVLGSALPRKAGLVVSSIIVLTFILQTGVNLIRPIDHTPYQFLRSDLRVAEFIRENTVPGSGIVVWGWLPKFHYLTGQPCGYRNSITFQLFLKSNLLDDRVAHFLNDLEENRPGMILEDEGGHHSHLTAIYKPLDTFPLIGDYIARHYVKVGSEEGISFYKRKEFASLTENVAAARKIDP